MTTSMMLSVPSARIMINYNGKLKSAELLLKEDGSAQLIRRAETPADYFATFDCFDISKKLLNMR